MTPLAVDLSENDDKHEHSSSTTEELSENMKAITVSEV